MHMDMKGFAKRPHGDGEVLHIDVCRLSRIPKNRCEILSIILYLKIMSMPPQGRLDFQELTSPVLMIQKGIA